MSVASRVLIKEMISVLLAPAKMLKKRTAIKDFVDVLNNKCRSVMFFLIYVELIINLFEETG